MTIRSYPEGAEGPQGIPGTNGTNGTNGRDGIGLPVPHVGVVGAVTFNCPDNGIDTTADGSVAPLWKNYPTILANNVSSVLLDPALDLRVELLWFKRKKKRGRATNTPGPTYQQVGSRWAHPMNWVGGNSNPHPGADTNNGTVNNVVGDRLSEWSITTRNQRVRVNLSKFFKAINFRYRDDLGNSQVVQALAAAYRGANAGLSSFQPVRGVSSAFIPTFFAFRYSIKDIPNGGVGRITGPLSEIIQASHIVSPLVSDFTYFVNNNGNRAYTINPNFVITDMKCSFNRRSKAAN
jgi:hypothetical protein